MRLDFPESRIALHGKWGHRMERYGRIWTILAAADMYLDNELEHHGRSFELIEHVLDL